MLTFVPTSDGYRVLNKAGGLVAHVRTKWSNDDHKDHVISFDSLSREEWVIHWGSPTQTLVELNSFMDQLPTE